MLPHAGRHAFEFGQAAVGVHDHVVEPVREAGEVAFRVDHDLLHVWRATLQQPAQQV